MVFQPLPVMHQLTMRQLQRPLADQVGSDSDVLVVKDSEEEDLQAAAAIPLAKAYFDPSQGCYVKALEGGKCIHGELKEGAGLCMVHFPDEEPFESQVPNLWLSSRKSAPAFKFSKRGKAAFGKAKKKAKRAAEPAGKEAEATVGSSKSGESNQELLAAAAPLELESWNGYPLAGMPQGGAAASRMLRPALLHREVKALILGTRHGDGHPRLLSPHQRALGSVQGLPGPAGQGGSLAGPAQAEEPIRNMADARRQTILAVYEDPRTGFGSIAQTLQQAQVRDPSISREEVKAFLDSLRDRPQRGYQLRACGAHEPAAGGPNRHEGLRGPLHAGGHRCADQESGRGAAEGPSCEQHRGGHEEGVPSPGGAGQRVLRRRLRV